MIYQILGGMVILLHFLWILFLLFGVLLAIRSPRIGWIHVGGLLLSLLLNGLDLYCPLTYLENYLHSFYGSQSSYTGSFIVHYLEYLIYPNLPEQVIRGIEVLFAGLYIIVYGYLEKRYHVLRKIRNR